MASQSGKKLRIAHVSPLFASVPPGKYGGTERVLDWLIREQVKMGYDVTLFASGDSITPAKLIPVIPRAIWTQKDITIPDTYHTIELDMVARMSHEFDVIHSHFNFIHYQSLRQIKIPMVTTLHWRVDIREFQDLYRYFSEAPLVAISHSQKSFIPHANVVSVIHHGIPMGDYPYGQESGDYIAFLGRFSPEKGVHIAIEVAEKLGIPIKIGAKLPDNERDKVYFDKEIKPRMKSSLIEYLGELDDSEKLELFKNARVTLVPTKWPEPFGLVTIESLACGTPVIARPVGCTKEIVKDGEVGYTATTVNEMIEAVKKIDKISRKHCRKYVEENFSSSVMAAKYEKVYRDLVAK